MRKLNENERLVQLEDMPINEEPCYIIVDASEADPAKVVTVQSDEVLVCAGSISNAEQRQAAYERYKAIKAGLPPPSKETRICTQFYIKVPISEINHKTGLTQGEEDMCNEFAQEVVKMKEL